MPKKTKIRVNKSNKINPEILNLTSLFDLVNNPQNLIINID